jgi:hypothetical protein
MGLLRLAERLQLHSGDHAWGTGKPHGDDESAGRMEW